MSRYCRFFGQVAGASSPRMAATVPPAGHTTRGAGWGVATDLNWNRRERDSNPREPFDPAGFQNRCHKPLGHLSVLLVKRHCNWKRNDLQGGLPHCGGRGGIRDVRFGIGDWGFWASGFGQCGSRIWISRHSAMHGRRSQVCVDRAGVYSRRSLARALPPRQGISRSSPRADGGNSSQVCVYRAAVSSLRRRVLRAGGSSRVHDVA